MDNTFIKTLFLDIGGVILSNGWDHALRQKAAQTFQIDYNEMNKRHALTFDTFEIGKISLDEYLDRVVFYTSRPFSKEQFKEFMFSQSHSYPEMLQLVKDTKEKHSLRVIAITNEGRELMDQRIHKFHLKEYIDIFICSGFVGLKKPDLGIYRMALDLSQTPPHESIYIDDRPMLAEIGQKLGMNAILHDSYESTRQLVNDFLTSFKDHYVAKT